MITQQRRRPVAFPPGVDGRAILAPLNHGAWNLPAGGPGTAGSDYRRAVTSLSPLLFAMTYLGHYLRQQDGDGQVSFSSLHMDLAEAARRWVAPGPVRDGWVAPREAAKTTWLFVILPLWALAHGHRRFFLAFSATERQARGHLAKARGELANNALLLADFPELARVRGQDTPALTVLAGGASLAAFGLENSTLGISSGAQRPDLIIGDDLEKLATDYSPAAKLANVERLTRGVLPMNTRAAVQITGTTTMAGSMTHDLVRHALGQEAPGGDWVGAHGFRARYYPPILDEGTEAARSLWPQRWSLAELLEMAATDPQGWALNYANRPDLAAAAGYWSRELFVVNASMAAQVREHVLYVDPAMTNNASSDQTAIVVVGRWGRFAAVQYAAAGRWPGRELVTRVHNLVERHDTIREVVVESNQGGDRLAETLSPLPRAGVSLWTEHVSGAKRHRLEAALAHYQREAVVHAAPFAALETQACAWTPAGDVDDLLDALAGGLRRVFGTVGSYKRIGGG